jgi:transcriptional regulator with XRE-family HTH domain
VEEPVAPSQEGEAVPRQSKKKGTPLGNKLKELRVAAGLTQLALAIEVGIDPQHVAAIEQGKKDNPTLKTLTLLADTFGVSLDELADHSVKANAPHKVRRRSS